MRKAEDHELHCKFGAAMSSAAAQCYPSGLHPVRFAAERACAAEATHPTRRATDIPVEESLRGDAPSASRRRGGVVAARQPLPLNTYCRSAASLPMGNRGGLFVFLAI